MARIRHLAIVTENRERLVKFYTTAFGMKVVWCNRYRQPRERLPGAPDREIVSLAELPALLGLA